MTTDNGGIFSPIWPLNYCLFVFKRRPIGAGFDFGCHVYILLERASSHWCLCAATHSTLHVGKIRALRWGSSQCLLCVHLCKYVSASACDWRVVSLMSCM